jgi:hypothetical protein
VREFGLISAIFGLIWANNYRLGGQMTGMGWDGPDLVALRVSDLARLLYHEGSGTIDQRGGLQ